LARGVREQARDFAARTGRLLDLWREYLRKVGSLSRAGAAVRLVDLPFTHPFITIPDAARILRPTYPAAQKNVEKLVEAGIVKERAGTSNPKDFAAGEILRRLDEPLTETPTTR
jgi:Fic family protein